MKHREASISISKQGWTFWFFTILIVVLVEGVAGMPYGTQALLEALHQQDKATLDLLQRAAGLALAKGVPLVSHQELSQAGLLVSKIVDLDQAIQGQEPSWGGPQGGGC